MLESAGPHMHSLLDTKAKSSRRWEFIWSDHIPDSVVNHATTHIIGRADLHMEELHVGCGRSVHWVCSKSKLETHVNVLINLTSL